MIQKKNKARKDKTYSEMSVSQLQWMRFANRPGVSGDHDRCYQRASSMVVTLISTWEFLLLLKLWPLVVCVTACSKHNCSKD